MWEKLAYAAPVGPENAMNPLLSFMPLILLVCIFYFLLIRPQQKRQKDTQKMINDLKKGDRIVTSGGVIGRITSFQDDYVVIKTGDSENKIEILKSAISGLREDKNA